MTRRLFSKMFFFTFLVAILATGSQSGCSRSQENTIVQDFSVAKAKHVLDSAIIHYRNTAKALPDSVFAASHKDSSLWCRGFYSGTLWYLYEYSGDTSLMVEANRQTELLEQVKYLPPQEDFLLFPGFGNGYRLTGSDKNKEALLLGASSLSSRYSSKLKVIKSLNLSGNKGLQYPVIIENMMNLELLMWAHKAGKKNNMFGKIAWTHANTTLQNQFRPDYHAYHVLDYDTTTGKVLYKQMKEAQDEKSSWAVGQTWALYGYTVMHRETGDRSFLKQAQGIADNLLNHEHMPKDLIPYRNAKNGNRDLSAAAIMVSALLELTHYTDESRSKKYTKAAETILYSLSSTYLTEPSTNGNFILKHTPADNEVYVPPTYADYYFVEALLRFLEARGEFYFQDMMY